MSVAIPVVAIAFGAVTPPQGDVIELRIHLGCTKEVSSFECLLQNFDKKYTVTNPINVGDNCHFDVSRGSNCPLILTGRVEEIEPESTPIENYIRVRGRCWGEKIFRRVVTKTYENQKGEAIVKDLLDNYVGLSHLRDSIELVENTDTTYTLLEYKDTPVFDILKYIAETADKSGVIGFDFRVEWDGRFAFFPKNSKTSPISLSEKIEHSRYSKDIHRVRNRIRVYGAAEKPCPLDVDGRPWSDSLTEDLTKPDSYLQHADGKWEPLHPTHETLSIETTTVHTGSKSVKIESSSYDYYMGIVFTFNSDKYVNCNLHPKLCFTLQEDGNHNRKITISLKDENGKDCWQGLDISAYDEWQSYALGVGKLNQESWTLGDSEFDWENIREVRLDFHQLSSKHGVAFVDRMHFGGRRWEATQEDSSSQSSYGLRELVEVDEELHSDNGCSLRAKALLDHLSQPAEFLTLRTTCLDYGTDRLLPGDKIHVTIPNENIDDDFRIVSVEYRVSARDQTLEITLELGKEKPLLADYLYGLRSTTITVEKLMRTKAGLTGGGFVSGGGGGGGGGMVQHGNEWHIPDFLPRDGSESADKVIITDGAGHYLQVPKLTTTERDALTPVNGMIIYNTTTNQFERYQAGSWGAFGSNGGGADEKVKVSSTDTTTNYLLEKLLAGEGITLTKKNSGADEDLEIKAHRRWNWLDEQSWNRMFYLPLTYGTDWTKKGSVLQKGASGKFDDVGVYIPCVLRVGDYYYLFYTGREGTSWPHDAASGIGVIRFTDPEGTYTRLNNGNPILEPGASEGYAAPSVIYDQYETDANKKWKMILGRVYGGCVLDDLLYSYSANPDSGWSTPTVISEFSALSMNFGSCLMKLGKLWYLLVPTPSSGSSVHLYVSKNVDSGWVSKGEVIPKSASGWDSAQIRFIGATYIFGVIYCTYSGYESGQTLKIGLAMAGENPYSYTKFGNNPVLTKGASGEFDDDHVYSPSLLQIENKFYMWYTGTKVGVDREIGLATIP